MEEGVSIKTKVLGTDIEKSITDWPRSGPRKEIYSSRWKSQVLLLKVSSGVKKSFFFFFLNVVY